MRNNLYKALEILADGDYHSGDDLGSALGVSRSAVWKQLQKLSDFGVDVESLKGRGYRISDGLDLLDQTVIYDQLSEEANNLIQKLVLLSEVDSTNTFVMSQANILNEFSGLICVAEQQSAGKGRRGRDWFTGFAKGLCFSLGWRFYGSAQVVEGLSLAIGLAVVQAIESLGYRDLELKWPNDILYQGRKLAGILIEMQGDLEGPIDIILGVGLNVYQRQDDRISQDWIALSELENQHVNRSVLLASMLNFILPVLASYETNSFSFYQNDWNAYDAFAGKQVNLLLGNTVETGIARGVDSTGALLIESSGEVKSYNGGEISVRINYDS